MADAEHNLILYVDDEWPNRVVFEQTFNGRFNVRALESPSEALAVLRREPVAVLVTDQRMPEMSGNELLEQARQVAPDTVRVVVTAFADLDPILRAVNDGLVARYVLKPWDRAEIEAILAWALEAHALGRESSALQLRVMQTERLVTLGSIAGAVVHDLQNPLAHLLQNAERLEELAGAGERLLALVQAHQKELGAADAARLADLAAELPELARDMRFGCNLMGEVTDGLRRMLVPRGPHEPQRCDPLPVIRYALSACREIALRARGRLVYDGPDALPAAAIGPTELTQVMINLVANAAQALARRGTTPRDGAAAGARTSPARPGAPARTRDHGPRVVVSAAALPEGVRLTVDDNGPGMPPDVAARVGKPFFSTRAEGTGLGVTQCKRLVEGAGGELRIDTAEGVGTTVTVLLRRA